MPSRHPLSAKLVCALAALCLLAGACSTKEPAGLTQSQVANLLEKWDAAQMNEDLEGVTACLSRKLQYKIYYKLTGKTDTVTGDYREYLESTKIGFDTGDSISANRTMGSIGLGPDGRSASVMGEVHYSMTVGGRLYRTVSTGSMTVGLEDGRAVFTDIDQTVTLDYEGRPMLDASRD